ncbi:MAG TPA: flagellar basal body L-ring protein FlgH [Candidatus Competibacteraceae bacterium]|nr:flagellar basal body L-ring protein FlgH [Candidatus Competibacteraceae bacterium]MCP5132242.1 flagellar basal body L-ring protein FlgH [Gammaproteobacteria bacterium]HPF59734.1 flagellar basal body L-ring protein FlgH [Candidatus Competibacteraceae bacterium]HRY17664.1 flagellar basal body L-ring protein FlgH [Candidatus Competibacteraceae bacterium]
MNKSATLLFILLLSGCSGLAPQYDFKPVTPQVMDVTDPARPAPPATGAIYQANRDLRLFEDRTARRVGDTVVIRLIESTAATKSATTGVSKTSNINLQNPVLFGASFGNPALAAGKNDYATTISGERELGGEGASDQSNSLTGNISAVVTGVYPNGNLAIRGEKMLTLNQGEEVVQISGVIRPEDIQTDNSILSSQVADAKITYAGNGVLADANTVSWLGRFFLSPLWPF